MTRAHDLYKRLTMGQLLEKQRTIREDPMNRNSQSGSIYLFTPKARKWLEDIAWAIRYHMEDRKSGDYEERKA